MTANSKIRSIREMTHPVNPRSVAMINSSVA